MPKIVLKERFCLHNAKVKNTCIFAIHSLTCSYSQLSLCTFYGHFIVQYIQYSRLIQQGTCSLMLFVCKNLYLQLACLDHAVCMYFIKNLTCSGFQLYLKVCGGSSQKWRVALKSPKGFRSLIGFTDPQPSPTTTAICRE